MTTEIAKAHTLIPLPRGRQAIVDSVDYARVADFGWRLAGRGYVRAYVRGSGRNNCRAVYMHRILLDAPAGVEVDHINHNPLDNRRSNLRLTTRSENMQNRRGPNRNSASGIRGVSWNKAAGKWQAQVMVNGKNRGLGYFHKLGDAAMASAEGRKKHMTHA